MRAMFVRVLLAMALTAAVPSVALAQVKPLVQDASDAFFEKGVIPRLRIEIKPTELEKLRANERSYVRCTIHENDREIYKDIAIKIKGAAGSSRPFDDKPALTLNMDRLARRKQSFHNLDKFHLNNSVQDESYLNELICSELFLRAGVPAPRVTHARVWLNERDVGLYVLKEGFDRTFLRRHFAQPNGNLYDGGFLQDIDAELEKDAGEGPDDRSDLRALTDAAREADPAQRWKRIDELLDVDAFLTFMAMERMTCHWDGYALNVNNYRLYFDPASKKAVLFPHGMDQMFGDPGMSLLDHPRPLLSSAIMQHNNWRARYRKRIGELLSLFSPADSLLKRIDAVTARLQPVLNEMNPDLARDHAERVRELKERIVARAENLRAQNDEPDPQPQEFDEKGVAQFADWYPVSEVEDAKHEEAELPGKKKAYRITSGPSGQCVASWRRHVLLAAGTYKLHAKVRTSNVVVLENEPDGGASVRISQAERVNSVRGTSPWKPLEFEFAVREDVREVELVLELRARRGEAWFDVEALRLTRQIDAPKGK